MSIIDLTRIIETDMEVYPGDTGVVVEEAADFTTSLCHLTKISLGSHTGTHIDAPFHFIKDGKKITDYSPDYFISEAICIKPILKKIENSDSFSMHITKEDEDKIRSVDALVISTGWDKFSGRPEFFKGHPVFSKEFAEFLGKTNIQLLGLDLPTVIREGDEDGAYMHQLLLGREILPVEGLVNLEKLVDRKFKFYAMPLPFLDSDGSPVRAFAEV